MEENNCKWVKGIFSLINLFGSIALIVLCLVWLFPIMNNSKKDEPKIEELTCLLPGYINLRYLELSNEECIKKGEEFVEKGAYETFNFKMNIIHQVSKGFISVLFIWVGFHILSFLSLLIFSLSNKDIFSFIYLFFRILIYLCEAINIIFFIILIVYQSKGKFDDFKEFGKCNFFDNEKFMAEYDYVFKVQKDIKKVLIVYAVLLALNIFYDILIKNNNE